MENQQTTETAAQNQPLNSAQSGNSAAQSRNERITKIKQKFLPGLRIGLLLSLIIYIAMLVIGILAVHKCPVEENIPLFLIATGAIGLITKILTYLRDHILRHFQVKYIESMLYTVETVFLILGAYWVYKEYPPNYEPVVGGYYCQKTAYIFAFVYITAVLVLIGLGIIGVLVCMLCCALCVATISSCCDLESQENEDAEEDKDEEKDEEKEKEKEKEGTSKE